MKELLSQLRIQVKGCLTWLIRPLWRWTGLGEKKLWDWLELLIVPAVLAIGAFCLEKQADQRQQDSTNQRYEQEQRIASDRYQQETLKAYLDQMTELLLEKNLRKPEPGSEVRSIARARTLTALRELDGQRKVLLLKFLNEANLISRNQVIVVLQDANLSNTTLGGVNLSNAALGGANLSSANLSNADLRGADLSVANLSKTELVTARLDGAVLRGTDLSAANLAGAELVTAELLGAKLRSAELGNANLGNANLHAATLSSANLINTNLSSTNLRHAQLTSANLSYTNLVGANLAGADLRGALNLTPDQVKAAKNWEYAKYDAYVRQQLGLPPETPKGTGSSKDSP